MSRLGAHPDIPSVVVDEPASVGTEANVTVVVDTASSSLATNLQTDASLAVVDTVGLANTLPSQALSSRVDPEQERLRGLEDRILKVAMTTVDDASFWQDIYGQDVKGPPQEWIDELGLEAAKRRFRVAVAACSNAKEAPVGLGMARATMMGITKVRSVQKVGSPTLSVNFVNFPAPVLEIIDIEGDSK